MIGRWEDSSRWLASPLLPSGDRVPAYFIRIWAEEGFLAAAEAVPGSRLPIVCPELHIPGDGTFCLARGSHPCWSKAAVVEFWQALGEYLVNQHFAARMRRWPAGRWLSHGGAALKAQLTAERAARAAGAAEDYSLYLENREGWIRAALDAPMPRRGDDCPKGCMDERGRVRSFGRCSRRRNVSRMLAAERERQRAEALYFDLMRLDGVNCCGRVDDCPLITERSAV